MRSCLRTIAEIEAEIAALKAEASKYDTKDQSNDTRVAAGAHDALRWALGLAEYSVAESFAWAQDEVASAIKAARNRVIKPEGV